jgi:starch synthase
MRSGQPCVVHGVGGLRDTIEDGVTGFMFGGETSREQADNFTATTLAALEQRADDPAGWKTMCDRAREQRFSWELSAQRTIRELYGRNDD